MKQHRALFAALFFIVPFLGFMDATKGGDTFLIRGAGRLSCGSWLEIRAKRDNRMDVRFIQLREWIDGYLTAYNVHVHPNGNVSAPTDPEGMYAWLDNYCQQNPTVITMAAVEALIKHLDRQ